MKSSHGSLTPTLAYFYARVTPPDQLSRALAPAPMFAHRFLLPLSGDLGLLGG